MIFSIGNGLKYQYDVSSNRISMWKGTIPLANPIVSFRQENLICEHKITMFTIEMTQECNLYCTYCCYSGDYRDRRKYNSKATKEDTLLKIVDFISENQDKESKTITVCFYGGESLLVIEKIKFVVHKLNLKLGERVSYSISTNGLLLSEKNIDWICSLPNCFVNVTLDGDKTMHDACRLTINGKGSFYTIMSNLKKFKDNYPDEFARRIRFLSTVNSWQQVPRLSDFWEHSNMLHNYKPVHISLLIPNFTDTNRKYDTYEIKDKFYSNALEEWKIGKDNIMVHALKKLVSIVERRVFFKMPEKQNIKTCLNEMFSCFINVDGRLYACEKFCDKYEIGNVNDGFDINRILFLQSFFVKRRNVYCSSCWAQRLCRMCLTVLNFDENEIGRLCEMERDSIKLSLKYYCEMMDYIEHRKNLSLQH